MAASHELDEGHAFCDGLALAPAMRRGVAESRDAHSAGHVDNEDTMGDGRRFDQALRALDKLIAEQRASDQAAQLAQPVSIAPAAQRA